MLADCFENVNPCWKQSFDAADVPEVHRKGQLLIQIEILVHLKDVFMLPVTFLGRPLA
jgi:hypothetical protein